MIRLRRAPHKRLGVASAAALVSVCMAACGGGASSLPPGVVAEVGHIAIKRATVEHWMTAMLGGDYHDSTSAKAPTTLLAPPPRHASCVSDLERAAAKPNAKKLTSAQATRLCGELYDAIKAQALTYLI